MQIFNRIQEPVCSGNKVKFHRIDEKFYASPNFHKIPAYKMYYTCKCITISLKDFLTETANPSSDFQM